jgi:hypothetical protein
MNLLEALELHRRHAELRRTTGLVEAAMRRLGRPVARERDGRLRLQLPPRFGYVLTLDVRPDRDRMHAFAHTGLVLARDWVTRELALTLLEENARVAHGQFRLAATDRGREVILALQMDLVGRQAMQVAAVLQAMLDDARGTMARVYALDAIVPGPLVN